MYKNTGQSTVEYVLLVAAVIAVMVAFTTGGFRSQLSNTYNSVAGQMNSSSGLGELGQNVGQGGAVNSALYNVVIP